MQNASTAASGTLQSCFQVSQYGCMLLHLLIVHIAAWNRVNVLLAAFICHANSPQLFCMQSTVVNAVMANCCRPLPAVFADQWASMEPGNRGGIRVPGATPHISVAADK